MGKKSFWLIFLASLFIRLIGSGQSFWLDEGGSIVLAKLPLSSLFNALRGDFHPPLFYFLLHLWLPFAGHSEWLIRLPFIIIGSLTVPIFYIFLTELFGDKKRSVAFAATFLLLINPLHVYYSSELRMYSANALLSLLSWLYLLRALKDKSKNQLHWRLFTLISLLNFYTFYGAIFNLISQWIVVLWQHKNKLKPFVICNLALGLLFLPWVQTLIKQLSGENYLTHGLSLKPLGLIMAKFTIGRISLANKSAYTIFVAGITLYFLLCAYLTSLTKGGKTLLIWFCSSIVMAIIINFRISVLEYWRFIFLVPPFIAIITYGLNQLPPEAYRFNLLAVFLIFLSGNILFFSVPMFQREDWRTAAKVISVDRSLTIVNFTDSFAPLKFYAPNVYIYPDQNTLGKTRSDLDQSLPLIISEKNTIFVFDYLSDLTDKKRSILSWLKQAGFIEQPTHNINGVGFIYEFKTP